MRGVRERCQRHPLVVGFAIFVVVAVLATGPAWLDPTHLAVGNSPRDRQAILWFHAAIISQLAHLHSPWFTTLAAAPNGFSLIWNTSSPLLAILDAPFRALLGLTLTQSLEMIIGMVVTAVCTQRVARRYTSRDWTAFVAGLLTGFGPYVLDHARGHVQLVWVFTVPLLIAVVDDLAVRQERGWRRDGLRLAVVVVVQFFLAEEVLLIEGIAVVVGLCALAISGGVRERIGYVARAVLLAGIVSVVVLAWPLHAQLFGAGKPVGAVQPLDVYVQDFNLLFLPSAGHVFYGAAWLIAVVLAAALTWRHQIVRCLAAVAGFTLLFSLGAHLHIGTHATALPLPWWLTLHIPILNDILPENFGVVVLPTSAIIVAIGLDAVAARRDVRAHGLRVLVAISALTFALGSGFVPAAALDPHGQLAFFNGGDALRIPDASTALVLPVPTIPNPDDAMMWQLEAGMRFSIVGGYYVGSTAVAYALPTVERTLARIDTTADGETLSAADRAEGLRELQAAHVQTVVVGPGSRHQAQTVAYLSALLGTSPQADGGVLVWWNVPA